MLRRSFAGSNPLNPFPLFRYTFYKAIDVWPTLCYNKLFTKPYQPFAIRYDLPLAAGLLFFVIYSVRSNLHSSKF